MLDTIVDEQALVKKQLAYSSEVALIEKDGEEKMRTIAVETLASLMNELSTEKAEIMTTTSLLKIVQFSQKIRNIKKVGTYLSVMYSAVDESRGNQHWTACHYEECGPS